MPTFYKFEYAILNEKAEEVDSSKGGEPLSFTVGDGSMIPGLERALLGHQVGDKFTVTIEPDDAYGHHQRQLVKTISKDMVQTDAEEITKGMVFQVGSGDDTHVVKVIEVEGDGIVVDGNHPLAGITFNFDITVLEVTETV
ncbi:MAG: FKBP-type peptidyl-prolyl cis-trans isomerase SlyD [Candidatus Azotimanducaceae bacterium]|jgi:FKBP-type peptidyl-prolyl cis-trans isomerase SlyD